MPFDPTDLNSALALVAELLGVDVADLPSDVETVLNKCKGEDEGGNDVFRPYFAAGLALTDMYQELIRITSLTGSSVEWSSPSRALQVKNNLWAKQRLFDANVEVPDECLRAMDNAGKRIDHRY